LQFKKFEPICPKADVRGASWKSALEGLIIDSRHIAKSEVREREVEDKVVTWASGEKARRNLSPRASVGRISRRPGAVCPGEAASKSSLRVEWRPSSASRRPPAPGPAATRVPLDGVTTAEIPGRAFPQAAPTTSMGRLPR